MRNELLAWFAREGLLLQDVTTSAEDPEHDEIKVSIKAPILALSRASEDFRVRTPFPVHPALHWRRSSGFSVMEEGPRSGGDICLNQVAP